MLRVKGAEIINGNAVDALKTLPDASVDMVITSPPYWNLRAYKTEPQIWGGDEKCEHDWIDHVRHPGGGKGSKSANVGANQNDEANLRDGDTITNFCGRCGAWRGELGLEPNLDLYIQHLCDIFDEVKRVLKRTGTCWVNLGDTYSTVSGAMASGGRWKEPKYEAASDAKDIKQAKTRFPNKCLLQIPNRFSIAMCDRGWVLRNEIIWFKRNCMPSSSIDRFTVDFEKIFFFVKDSKRYFFETQYEPYEGPMNRWGGDKLVASRNSTWDEGTGQSTYRDRNLRPNALGRIQRCVWDIPTKGLKDAHFATFPEQLLIDPINAGSFTTKYHRSQN